MPNMENPQKLVVHVFRRYPKTVPEDIIKYIDREFTWFKHLRSNGYDPFVIHGAEKDKIFSSENFEGIFIKDVNRISPLSHSSRFYQEAAKEILHRQTKIVHLHNILDVLSAIRLKKRLGTNIAILLQDHGSVPRKKHFFYRPFFRRVDAFLFNSPGQELAWTKAGLIQPSQCYFAPEGTSNFEIQAGTKERGEKINLISIGNLDHNKDPLTILRGLKLIRQTESRVYLKMIFKKAPLLAEVKRFIEDAGLQNHVDLVGSLTHAQIGASLEDSHFIISASHKEGSGYSVIEAMSFGVIPILSDIPSFRDFTDTGTIGAIFQLKNPSDLAAKTLTIIDGDWSVQSRRVKERFQNTLSQEAIGRRLAAIYEEVLRKK